MKYLPLIAFLSSLCAVSSSFANDVSVPSLGLKVQVSNEFSDSEECSLQIADQSNATILCSSLNSAKGSSLTIKLSNSGSDVDVSCKSPAIIASADVPMTWARGLKTPSTGDASKLSVRILKVGTYTVSLFKD